MFRLTVNQHCKNWILVAKVFDVVWAIQANTEQSFHMWNEAGVFFVFFFLNPNKNKILLMCLFQQSFPQGLGIVSCLVREVKKSQIL